MAKGLGKGLGALFSDNTMEFDFDNAMNKVTDHQPVSEPVRAVSDNESVVEVSLDMIFPNPNQPRKNFDEAALQELADSIKTHGIIQPIVVVKREGKYMIIAGERRWRASALAGLEKVPVIINKAVNEQKIKELSLIENLQREDLNPVEAATAIQQLMDEFNFTQEEVAQRLGKNRSTIANTLRLLNLCPQVLAFVAAGRLSAGHARTLVVVVDTAAQYKLAKAALDNKITVRDLEKMVKNYLNPKQTKQTPQMSLELKELVDDMQRVLGTKVGLLGNDHKGRIYIDYYTRDDLDRIYDIIEKQKQL